MPAGRPNVATTDAAVPDVAMTEKVHQGLQQRGLLPREHYVDSGYDVVEVDHRLVAGEVGCGLLHDLGLVGAGDVQLVGYGRAGLEPDLGFLGTGMSGR